MPQKGTKSTDYWRNSRILPDKKAGVYVVGPRELSYAAREVGFYSSPEKNRMTIAFRLFGYTVCFSIAKVIRVPSHRF